MGPAGDRRPGELLVFALVTVVILWAQAAAAESGGSTAPGADARDFTARQPAGKRGRLLCLKTEDHYLRVYTDRGEALILLRLKDALRELQGHDGRQVHRSYWVSRAAVSDTRRDGRKTLLVLSNGLEVPVSQTYLRELKADGWLAQDSVLAGGLDNPPGTSMMVGKSRIDVSRRAALWTIKPGPSWKPPPSGTSSATCASAPTCRTST